MNSSCNTVSHTHTHACVPQASQLGVYRAFVDNYKVAVETADKCCQANAQFAEISEVCDHTERLAAGSDRPAFDVVQLPPPGTSDDRAVLT